MYNPKFLSLLGIVILCVISIPLARSLSQKNRVENEINNIKEEINDLKNRNKGLEDLVKYLKSDQFVEEQARLNFGLKKRGEEVVVIKNKGRVAGVSDSQNSEQKHQHQRKSNPEKWLNYFFEE